MDTNTCVVKRSAYRTNEWSGGTTTELFIYPPGSSYSERNFKWRISSATVDALESTFTRLPGITRHIMVIEGSLVLEHKGRYRKELHPFEQDVFMGEWNTKSRGRATDFNLMLAGGFSGRLEACFIEEGQEIELTLDAGCASKVTNVLYPLNGSLEVSAGGQKFNLLEKELFSITPLPGEGKAALKLTNKSGGRMAVIRAEILEKP